MADKIDAGASKKKKKELIRTHQMQTERNYWRKKTVLI